MSNDDLPSLKHMMGVIGSSSGYVISTDGRAAYGVSVRWTKNHFGNKSTLVPYLGMTLPGELVKPVLAPKIYKQIQEMFVDLYAIHGQPSPASLWDSPVAVMAQAEQPRTTEGKWVAGGHQVEMRGWVTGYVEGDEHLAISIAYE